jgi:hypothetical protein
MGVWAGYFDAADAEFVGADRVVLDASIVLVPSGMDRSLGHSKATMAAWPEGGEASFLTDSVVMSRTAYTLDALQLFARSIDAMISRDKSPLIAADLMSSLRTTSVQGLTGNFKIEADWNNIRSRGYTINQIRILHGHGTIGTGNLSGTKMVVENLGVSYTDRAAMRVCSGAVVPPAIGTACEDRAEQVEAVQAFGLNSTSLRVNWRTRAEFANYRSGYRLSLSSDDDYDIVEIVPPGVKHMIFGLDRVKANVHYRVRVIALYDDGNVQATPNDCRDPKTCGGSLACIPNTTGTSTCGCSHRQIHTMKLVEGVPPEAWGCRECLDGLVCRGGTAESTVTAKGWFVGSTLGLTKFELDDTQSTHDSSKCLEFGFPVAQRWQSDPGCCSIHTNAGCTDNYTVSMGDMCGSGSWGVAHFTKCEAASKTATGERFPSLLKCAKESACPGGFPVSRLIGVGEDVDVLFSQCNDGFTGFECAACLPGYSYLSCRKCAVTRDEALALAIGVLLILLVSAGIGYVALKRASRPPLVERRFIVAFVKAEAKYGIGGSLRGFCEIFGCTAESGVGHDDFVRALTPGGKLESVTAHGAGNVRPRGGGGEGGGGRGIGRVASAAVQSLWDKLDVNGDGHITASEFLDFFYDLKRGTGSTNPLKARLSRLYRWYCSTKTQTLKVVLITYFQLVSSIPRSYPLVAGKKSDETDSSRGEGSAAAAGNNSTTTGPLASMRAIIEPVLDVLGNVNVQAADGIQCMVGPRYIDRLIFTAVVVLGSVGTAWAVVGAMHMCACICGRASICGRRRLARHMRSTLSASSAATTVSIQILFLLYPMSCGFIMRTWVCDSYNVNGEKRRFMADDKFVECNSSEYGTVVAVAGVLVVVVVVGMPALQYMMLRRWRQPFDQLFVPTEEGRLVPSVAGDDVLGPLYVLYKPRFYMWALADAAVKLIFTGLLGVVFNDEQQTGLVFSAILCVGLVIVTAILMPFVYQTANYIVLATYAAIIANCAEAAMSYSGPTDETTPVGNLHVVLETVTLVLYVFPFAIGFWDLFEVSSWPIYRRLKKCAGKAAAALCFVGRMYPAHKGNCAELAIVIKAKDCLREARLDERRSRQFAVLLSELRPLADSAAASFTASKSVSRCEKGKADQAVDAYTSAVDTAVDALGEYPLALQWKHYIAVESTARKLSKIVFEGQPVVMKGGGGHGEVVLAFENVRELWNQGIARNVCVTEADGDDTAVPSMKAAVVCRNAVVALLFPGAHMGSFHMDVTATVSFRAMELLSQGVCHTGAIRSIQRPGMEGAAKLSAVLPAGTCDSSAINPMRRAVGDYTDGDGGGGETKQAGSGTTTMVGTSQSTPGSPTSRPRPRSALRFASPALRGDIHVVMAAVRHDGDALEYASPELQGHRDVVLAAVQGGTSEVNFGMTSYCSSSYSDHGDGGDHGDDGAGLHVGAGDTQVASGDDERIVVHRSGSNAVDEASEEVAC